jgi:hypothetical protein
MINNLFNSINIYYVKVRLIDQEIPLLEHMMHLKQTGQQFVRPDPPKVIIIFLFYIKRK